MAAVTICSDFGAQENKVCCCFHCFPIYLPWSDGTDAMILVFWMVSFKPTFSLSSFTLIKRLCSSSSVQFCRSVVSDSVTPWTAACQASLSITNSQSLLKLMSIELMMPFNHLILCCPLLLLLQFFPASESFPMSLFFASGGQSTGVSASESVLPMNIQDWFPLG